MVTKRIFDSGSLLAGFSVDYLTAGFRGNKDFRKLVEKDIMEDNGNGSYSLVDPVFRLWILRQFR